MSKYDKDALHYHKHPTAGKIEIRTTKALDSQEDLSLAYSPGVAAPCLEIEKNPQDSYHYTNKGNLVGVISNGSAVLGLGNIGALASKPVMEGKAMLFKKFANIDVFDIEIATKDPDEFIKTVLSLEPTFGAINLEDIKAPECFYIEEQLSKKMSIPVFHDDQHGTAIIAAAAFINALKFSKREMDKTKIVFSGAGAAAIATIKMFLLLGAKKENIIVFDSKGVLSTKRQDLSEIKKAFACDKSKDFSLKDALMNTDAFVGVSKGGVLTKELLEGMNKDPIVFALANPDPEILPSEAKQIRKDVIIATGRSDFPNQVNNVLGFPYIFRGALDVRAKAITNEMKLAAVYAIADLAYEDVPEDVLAVYNKQEGFVFGKDYLIPKPVDQRVLLKVAPAVAKAAMESGVARIKLDIEEYKEKIERILGPARQVLRSIRREIKLASNDKPRILLTTTSDIRVLKAAKQIISDGQIELSVIGRREEIFAKAKEANITLPESLKIYSQSEDKNLNKYIKNLYELRKRKGISFSYAKQLLLNEHYYGAMLLRENVVDGIVSGINTPYREAVRPLLKVIGKKTGSVLSGIYLMIINDQIKFFADCTINTDPSAIELAEIATQSAKFAASYTKEKIRVAFLSFASFGGNPHKETKKIAQSVEIVKSRNPSFEVDGEMGADVALDAGVRNNAFPFCSLTGNANVLIFPSLAAANIAYKLLTHLGGAVPMGPVIMGLNQSAHAVRMEASVKELVSMIYLTAHESLSRKKV
jgi:malate dehydrogenase (oxaloacetate-decarboxylating)(NADP+)